MRQHLSFSFYPPPHHSPLYWCGGWCGALLLPLGERGDELAAEVGDVGDDAAPDQVECALETSGHASVKAVTKLWWGSSRPVGVHAGVRGEIHEKARP